MQKVPVVIAVLMTGGVALLVIFSGAGVRQDIPPNSEPPAREDRIPPPLPDEAPTSEDREDHRIEGKVVCGSAVAGARVAAYPPGLFSRRLLRWTLPTPAAAAEADAEGRFALDLPKGRKWLYCVDAPGYFRQWTEDPAHIRLTPGRGERSVLVLDESGVPLTNATAVLYRFHLEGPPLCEPVRADRDGKITVRVVAGLDLLVRAPGYADGWVSYFSRSPSIRLKPGLALAGAVVDSDRRAIPGAEVLLDHHYGVRPDEIATTDAQGCFRFGGLEKRRKHYTLTASRPGFSTRSFDVKAGEEAMELPLLRPGTISGTASLPDGGPASGATVGGVTTDEEGRFRIEGVTPGIHTLAATAGRLPGMPKGLEALPRFTASVTVTVREGEAAAGVRIGLHEQVYSYVVLKLLDCSGAPENEMYVWNDNEDRRIHAGSAVAGRRLLVLPIPAGTGVNLGVHDWGGLLHSFWDPLEPDAKLDVEFAAVTSTRTAPPETVVRLPRPARITIRVLDEAEGELRITMNDRVLNSNEPDARFGYVHPDHPFQVSAQVGAGKPRVTKFPAPGGDKTVEVRAR